MKNSKTAFISAVFSSLITLTGASTALASSSSCDVTNNDRIAIKPFKAKRFVTLPIEANSPEGITSNPVTGDIFIGTLDLAQGTNFLIRYDERGNIEAQLPVGLAPVAGLAFNDKDDSIYFARLGNLVGQAPIIQRVPENFDANTSVEDVAIIPEISAPAPRSSANFDGTLVNMTFPDSFPLPLGLVFDRDGDLFLTDALQAAIFSIEDPSNTQNTCPTGSSCVSLTIQDSLLATGTFPNLGANDLAFSDDESRLYISNTGDDRLLTLDMANNQLSILADGLEGIDGLVTGPNNTIIASLALADEIVVLDADTGAIKAELGEFRGIDRNGAPIGLLFPGSITRVNNNIYANNLAFVQTGRPAEPERLVSRFTMSRIGLPNCIIR